MDFLHKNDFGVGLSRMKLLTSGVPFEKTRSKQNRNLLDFFKLKICLVGKQVFHVWTLSKHQGLLIHIFLKHHPKKKVDSGHNLPKPHPFLKAFKAHWRCHCLGTLGFLKMLPIFRWDLKARIHTPLKFNMVHLKIPPWKRRFRTWKPSFSGMLNLGGVPTD